MLKKVKFLIIGFYLGMSFYHTVILEAKTSIAHEIVMGWWDAIKERRTKSNG